MMFLFSACAPRIYQEPTYLIHPNTPLSGDVQLEVGDVLEINIAQIDRPKTVSQPSAYQIPLYYKIRIPLRYLGNGELKLYEKVLMFICLSTVIDWEELNNDEIKKEQLDSQISTVWENFVNDTYITENDNPNNTKNSNTNLVYNNDLVEGTTFSLCRNNLSTPIISAPTFWYYDNFFNSEFNTIDYLNPSYYIDNIEIQNGIISWKVYKNGVNFNSGDMSLEEATWNLNDWISSGVLRTKKGVITDITNIKKIEIDRDYTKNGIFTPHRFSIITEGEPKYRLIPTFTEGKILIDKIGKGFPNTIHKNDLEYLFSYMIVNMSIKK